MAAPTEPDNAETHLSEETIARYRSRQLSPDALGTVDAHTATCEGCRMRLAHLSRAAIRATVHQTGVADAADRLPDDQLIAYIEGRLPAPENQRMDQLRRQDPEVAARIADLEAFQAFLRREGGALTLPQEAAAPRSITQRWSLITPVGSALAGAAAVALFFFLVYRPQLEQKHLKDARRVGELAVETRQQQAALDKLRATLGEAERKAQQSQLALAEREASVRATQTALAKAKAEKEAAQQQASQLRLALEKAQRALRNPLPGLDDAGKRLLAQANQTGVVPVERRAEFDQQGGTLAGPDESPAGFAIVGPVDTTILSQRPTLEWTPRAGASHYSVSINDLENPGDPIAVSGPTIKGTTWSVPKPLPRGRFYSWQITAYDASGSPLATAPTREEKEARFRVLPASNVPAATAALNAQWRLAVLNAATIDQGGLGMTGNAVSLLRAVLAAGPDPELDRKARTLLRTLEK